ncbi:hypothetical protein COCOBI_01-8750 [Coccomyxa sp. Obi]|nr:hypothetical protein COCOBI_01-8750 [Coccomyxa sp. Obi]
MGQESGEPEGSSPGSNTNIGPPSRSEKRAKGQQATAAQPPAAHNEAPDGPGSGPPPPGRRANGGEHATSVCSLPERNGTTGADDPSLLGLKKYQVSL